MKDKKNFQPSCPISINNYPNVLLSHGSGGTLMSQLIEKMFVEAFKNSILEQRHDSAVIDCGTSKLAVTTDSYVVHPLFFPGGDIGSMSVYGTVNDLAMSGAVAKYISVGFIIEEGLPMDTLWKVVLSMKEAADKTKIKIITGDTKVVDKGKGDGIFINTTGIGFISNKVDINPKKIKEKDAIIVSGDIGRHGMSIMAEREGLEFESTLESDLTFVSDIVEDIIKSSIEVHCMRDLTRGGLGSALNEIASFSGFDITINEKDIPVSEQVHGVCEILGFDPMFVACEGRFVLFVSEKDSEESLNIMKKHLDAKNSTIIGTVVKKGEGIVSIKSIIGVERIVEPLTSQQLPRIC